MAGSVWLCSSPTRWRWFHSFDRQQANAYDIHSSCDANRLLAEQPLSLSQCLHVFTKDEKLEAYCSNCSRQGDDVIMRQQVCRRAQATAKPWMCSAVRCGVDHSLLVVGVEQTKKMDLWRVPPILVIQLKRFQFTECDTLATLVPPCAHHLTVLVIACHVCVGAGTRGGSLPTWWRSQCGVWT